MGEPIVVKDFEKDFVDNEIAKRKDLELMKSSTNAINYLGSATIALVKQCRKELK